MEQPIAPQAASDALGAVAALGRIGRDDPAPAGAPNTDGIWYASYPPGVPHEIDVSQYRSVPPASTGTPRHRTEAQADASSHGA